MKKIISLMMAIAIICALVGCKSEKNIDVAENTTQKVEERAKKDAENNAQKVEERAKKDAENNENIEDGTETQGKTSFKTENGKITFLGVEKAEPGITNEENAYVIKYEVTNEADEPREGNAIFYFDIYQNNVEVDDINYRIKTDSEQSTILDNEHKGIMTGGTLVAGKLIVLNDTTPLTIYLRDGLDLNTKSSITVNVK